MAHLPPGFLADLAPFSQPKTLFLPAPGTLGILVTHRAGRFTSKAKRFASPRAALAWCLSHRAALVFWWPAGVPQLN